MKKKIWGPEPELSGPLRNSHFHISTLPPLLSLSSLQRIMSFCMAVLLFHRAGLDEEIENRAWNTGRVLPHRLKAGEYDSNVRQPLFRPVHLTHVMQREGDQGQSTKGALRAQSFRS